ncbi:MAG: glycosyltransferase family 4 protein [Vicinamibacterales bacterium]
MRIAFVVPGRLEARTGGSTYNRRIVHGLRARSRRVEVVEIDGAFPAPDAGAVRRLDDALTRLTGGTVTVVDGLIFGCVPEVAERHASHLCLVSLVHLPLAADPGLGPEATAALRRSEQRALRSATHVVITGSATLDLLDGYGVPEERITLVEPGTDRPSAEALAAARAQRSRGDGIVRLLSVATLNPGKGHAPLLSALAATGLTHWHLTCAGSVEHHPHTVADVQARIRQLDLTTRVTLAGNLDDTGLAAAYQAADVFVLATRRETYGMAVSSALAWGLPVVSTHTGAIPDMVGDTAGIVVPVDDDAALTDALRRVLGDAALRATLAHGALLAAEQLPSWHDQVAAFERVLDRLPSTSA